jgi:hypothetical protein
MVVGRPGLFCLIAPLFRSLSPAISGAGQSHENSNILKYQDNFSEHQFVNIYDFTGLRFLCDGPVSGVALVDIGPGF